MKTFPLAGLFFLLPMSLGFAASNTVQPPPKPPRSDAKVLHADFENYVDGIVQALNAGVRWLGDPYSGRKQGKIEITRGNAFAGKRAAFVATSTPDEIGRVRLQRRFDAPPLTGDTVIEFVFRVGDNPKTEMNDFTLWSAQSSRGRPVGLVLKANRKLSANKFQLIVTHAQTVGTNSRQSTPITLKHLSSTRWIRVIQHRRREQGTVELWAGIPGDEKLLGTFPDLDKKGDVATVELGDTSTKTSHGCGFWDDIRIGGRLNEPRQLAPPEPPLRNVSQEPVSIESPLIVGRARQLFLDDVVIENQTGLHRSLHQAQKHPKNPLIVPDKPWEGRCVLLYGGVVRDPSTKQFRMWYLAWGKHIGQPSFICYAESSDGIRWQKPKLNIHDYQGTPNNIVLPGWSQTSVLYDPVDPNRNRRYKALLRYKGTRGFTSPDGLHWTDVGILLEQAYDSTTLHWDPRNQKWVAMVKIFKNGKRARGYAESKDFLNWSDTYFMSTVDKQDASDDQMYAMSMFHYQSTYVGLLRMYHTTTDVVDIQMATSRNGKRWSRPTRNPFIPTGPNKGDWDFGNNAVPATPPLRVGNELWFYYCGRSTLHNEIPNNGAIGLATLRVDGFASMDAETQGTLTTKPLKLAGNQLFINADASQGNVRVEILDKNHQPLEGFHVDDATAVTGNQFAGRVHWNDNQKLPRQPVQLRFHLNHAKLYAFWAE